MSVSDQQRRDDKRRTLLLMVQQIGDLYVWQREFEPSDEEFRDVLQTTWRELLDDGLIHDTSTMNCARFGLTSAGWLRGLSLSDAIDSADMRDRCTRLARTLKAVVKGRASHFDEFADVDATAKNAGLPPGWVFNAIKCRLLGVVFPDDRWDAQIDPKDHSTIRVSPTFGLNHLLD